MKFLLLPIFVFLSFPVPTHAANPGDVVINEIAWMGTTNSPADEWIELYNNTNISISLEGWILRATDGKPNISLSKTIGPGSFFLLERTDDTSVPDVSSDQIYTGDLGNSGEHLELLDAQANITDRLNAFGTSWIGWGGDNDTKQTMERVSPKLVGSDQTSWKTSLGVGGTPKAQNSVYQSGQTPPVPPPQPALSPAQSPTSTEPNPTAETIAQENITPSQDLTATNSSPGEPAPLPPVYPPNIFINELMPYPLGPDELEEWIEIINENDEPSDISLWQIKDTLGATNIYTLPRGTILAPRSFLVLSRLTAKITLNNDGDAVQIVRPDGELAQTVPYEKAERGKSYVRNAGVWSWSSIPTPGSANIVPAPLKKAGTIEDIKKVTQNRAAPKEPDEKTQDFAPNQTASIGESANSSLSSKETGFIASLIALFSAVFVFLLKKSLARP